MLLFGFTCLYHQMHKDIQDRAAPLETPKELSCMTGTLMVLISNRYLAVANIVQCHLYDGQVIEKL